MAQSHSKRWQKALQTEREQRIRLEETLEQLAKQHNHLERAFRGATVLPPSFSNPALGNKGESLFIIGNSYSATFVTDLLRSVEPLSYSVFQLFLHFRGCFRESRCQWRRWWQWVLWCYGGASRVYYCPRWPQISQVQTDIFYCQTFLFLHMCFVLYLTLILFYRRSGSNISGISSETGTDDQSVNVR